VAGGESKVAVVAALLGNLLIAILKLVAGLISGSASMLAEAAHSFSDVGNQILLLVGIARANSPPSAKHPYGTGKAAYFWPFMVAILLFGIAGAYSVFEGYEKMTHPHEVGDIRLSLAVLGVAFAIEIVSLTVALRETVKASRARGIGSTREFLAENRDATLLTVIVEDSLALAGLPIAAAALALTAITHNPVWDGIGSLVIGLMLMGFAVFLAREVHVLLLGTGLSKRDLGKVQGVLATEPAFERVLNVQSMYLGPHAVLLGIEVDVKDELPAAEVEATVARAKTKLADALPVLRYIFIEPKKAGP
jgi:cation diffusion facilitator family transporter